MVMIPKVIQIFLFVSFSLLAADVQVSGTIEESQSAGSPIKGLISIQHSQEEEIDPQSFKMEGKPLEVSFVRSVQVTPPDPLTLSIYAFTLPPQAEGLYLLPEIEVKVKGTPFRSPASSYAILGASKQQPIEKGVVLRLEPFVEAPMPMYPGQKTRVGYRYFFTYSVDLKKEEVPLLKAEGFKKIGEPTIVSKEQGGLNVVEASQEIEAVLPGRFVFGPSIIEGFPYVVNANGANRVGKELLRSVSPEVVIDVAPFPLEGMPGSFKGAIGDFDFRLELLQGSEVNVGEKIILQATIQGKGDLDEVSLLPLCCYPGLSGYFEQSDLPPVIKYEEGKKEFLIELRPKTAEVKEIPPIEFSFFNPESKKFVIKKSQPIPITVFSISGLKSIPGPVPEQPLPIVKPIDIEANYPLKKEDQGPIPFGTFWTLLLIPIGLLILFLLKQFYDWKKTRPEKKETSIDLFAKAIEIDPKSPHFLPLIQEAFLKRVEEKGAKEEQMAHVNALLLQIEKARFGKGEAFPSKEEIDRLFREIGA